MTTVSGTPRLVTKKGRVFVTNLSVDELLEVWRTRYDAIFAQEARSRRLWGSTARAGKGTSPASDVIEAQIQARQVEWDEYVREQLADLVTAK